MSPCLRPLTLLGRRLPVVFELLEPRRLFAISVGPDGFTQFDLSTKSVLYVSSSTGNDSNNGSINSPLQSVAKARSLVNAGQGDSILLKRGDVFGTLGNWTKSGPSATDPLVIGAYGTPGAGQDPRAVIHSGTLDGFVTFGNGGAVNNIAIFGIHFFADGYDGTNAQPSGIKLLKPATGFLVEDVEIEGYKDNIVLQGEGTGVDGFTLRRSVIVDAYSASGKVGHSQGMYASPTTKNLLIEENVFDNNGWKEGVAAPVGFNHNMYIQTGAQGVVVRGNVVSRASYNGILLRAGGTVTDNLIIRSPVGVIVSNTASTVDGNVILEGTDLPDLAQGVGVNSVKLPGFVASNNIIAHDTSNFTAGVAGVILQWGVQSGSVSDNIIFDWRHGISSGGASVAINDNQIQEQDAHHQIMDLRDSGGGYSFSGNIYSSPNAAPFTRVTHKMDFAEWQSTYEPSATNEQLNYLDPWRDVGTYGSTFAGLDGSFDGWIAAVRGQTAQNWNANLMAQPAEDWIREGFQLLDPNNPNGSNGKIIVNVIASDSFSREVDDPSHQDLGTFRFTRTGPLDSPLTVTYDIPVPPGTADPIDDYPTLKKSVTFPAGVAAVTENIVPIWDHEVEGTEYAVVSLNPGADYTVGPRKRATVIIDDADDAATPGGGTGGGGGGTGTGGGGGGTGGGGTPTGGGGEGGGTPGEDPITGDGLFGQYFNDESLSGTPDFTRRDYLVNMDFGTNSPGGNIVPTTWGAQWTGFIEPEFGDPIPEAYTFRLPASDGARLWIDNQLVIDNWSDSNYPGDANQSGKVEIGDFNILASSFGKSGKAFTDGDFDGNGKVDILDFNILATNFGKNAPARNDSGTINLLADTKYAIKIEFRNTAGPANVKLYWSSPSQIEEVVPHQRLYSGFVAEPAGASGTLGRTSGATPSTRTGTIGTGTFSSQSPIAPIDDQQDALALAGLV